MREETVWRVGGEAYALDLMDGETIARYSAALDAFEASCAGADGAGAAGMYGVMCVALRVFFDALFGEGAGDKLIGEGADLRRALGVYGAFLRFGKRQADGARRLMERTFTVYAPERALGARDGHCKGA